MSIIKTPYNAGDLPGGAKQEFRNEVDINIIVKRAINTGYAPVLNAAQPAFADVSAMPDFAESLRRHTAALDAFQTLPSELRMKFNNDPVALVAFCSDDKNYEAARVLGLLPPKPEPLPVPAPAPIPAPVPESQKPA